MCHETRDATVGEQRRHVGEQLHGLEEVACHHRDVHVELESAVAAAPGDRGVVADHLRADLGHGLGEHRVDLAGHDRRAGLQVGQLDLAKPGERTRTHPAHVVGDLGQRNRDRAQRAGALDEPVARGLRLERILRQRDRLDAGQLAQLLDHGRAVALGRIEARAHGRATDRQLGHAGERGLEALDTGLDLAGVSGEFLAEGHRNGVHQVGAAGLDHGLPLLGLAGESGVQVLQRGDQVLGDRLGSGDVGRGRERVVRGLRHVHVVVGVNLGAGLAGERGDDLVGVHVRGRARTGLEHVDREVGVDLAIGDLLRGGLDRTGLLVVEQAEVVVHRRTCALEQAERADLRTLERAERNGEVLHGTLGLRAV